MVIQWEGKGGNRDEKTQRKEEKRWKEGGYLSFFFFLSFFSSVGGGEPFNRELNRHRMREERNHSIPFARFVCFSNKQTDRIRFVSNKQKKIILKTPAALTQCHVVVVCVLRSYFLLFSFRLLITWQLQLKAKRVPADL